jgi:predicted Zn-dependent protease
LEGSPGFAAGTFEGAVLLHELGHAMGLAHPSDTHQMMWPQITPTSPRSYQSGDVAGLRTLSGAPC